MKTLLPWLVAVAFFMESLDTTILNTAVPSIAAALHVAPLSMKVALTSYTLSLAVFIPVSGWMADRYGTRRVFATAIGIFSLGSFLCGVASSIHMLVAARILQGCGGSMMVPVGRLTLVRTFERRELVRVLSFVSIPALVGPLVGPLAGGLIVGYLHWSLIFFVNVPIGVIGLYLVLRYLPDYRADEVDPLDVTGMVLFGAGVALLSYVLEVFGEHTLSVLEMAGLLALAVALLVALAPCVAGLPSCAAIGPVSHADLPGRGDRKLRDPPRRGRDAVSLAAAVPGRPRVYGGAVGAADHAAVLGRHQPEVHHTGGTHQARLPARAGHQHPFHGTGWSGSSPQSATGHRSGSSRCRPWRSAMSPRCSTRA